MILKDLVDHVYLMVKLYIFEVEGLISMSRVKIFIKMLKLMSSQYKIMGIPKRCKIMIIKKEKWITPTINLHVL